MASKKISQLVVFLATLAVFIILLTLLNTVTAPRIEANNNAALYEPLYAVMPEAKSFRALDIPHEATVDAVWEETSGLGYVVQATTNKGYTHDDIKLTIAISTDGKISGISLDAYPETKDFGKDTYPQTYIGQDSTLSGVSLVAGVTFSSTAFKGAVADAFAALTENGLVTEATKEPGQVISEMLPEKAPGMVTPQGSFQGVETECTAENVVKCWVNPIGSVAAFWMNNGKADYLVVANASGSVSVYDLKGNDVSAQGEVLSGAALRESLALLKPASDKELKKVTKLLPSGAAGTTIKAEGIYSTVSAVMKAETADGVYYGFIAHSFGFSNNDMSYYVVLDPDGKIYGMNTGALIIEPEYFSVSVKKSDYVAALKGVGADWNGDEAVVAGATLTTQATQTALNDIFAAYSQLKGGNN